MRGSRKHIRLCEPQLQEAAVGELVEAMPEGHKYAVGDKVKVVRLVDLAPIARRVGTVGVVEEQLNKSSNPFAVHRDFRYWVRFKDGKAHAFYENELEVAT